MSIAANQAIRNGNLRHRQSIGRQRKQASTPEEVAAATAKVIEKRHLDGQPIPAWVHIDTPANDEPSAADLAAILPTDEWPALPADDTPADEAPQPAANVPAVAEIEAPAAPVVEPAAPEASWPAPSWHDHNAALTHHLQWVDSEGCQHGLTIRADNLDDLVRPLTAVKALIATAKTKATAAKESTPQPTQPTPEAQLSSRRCDVHDAPMFKAISKRTGRPYASHLLDTGERCFGR